jgi:D-arabinose 1-dehydrogenase-like Zn-dependent alcohol dehydrogenase
METLVNGLAVDGQLVLLAVAEGLSIPVVPMIMSRLSIKGWPSGTAHDSEECVAFANMEGIKCRVERFELDRVQEAYEAMLKGSVRFRAVLTF